MSISRVTSRWAAGLGLGFATACGAGPAGPEPVPSTYVLQSLNESALPYDHEGLGCCTYLSGELRLQDGHYTISLTARNRNTGLTFTVSEWGIYALDLPEISFTPEGYQVQPLLLDVGIAADPVIRVKLGGEGPGSPDQFRAIFVRAP